MRENRSCSPFLPTLQEREYARGQESWGYLRILPTTCPCQDGLELHVVPLFFYFGGIGDPCLSLSLVTWGEINKVESVLCIRPSSCSSASPQWTRWPTPSWLPTALQGNPSLHRLESTLCLLEPSENARAERTLGCHWIQLFLWEWDSQNYKLTGGSESVSLVWV